MWNYFFFIAYLLDKDPNDHTGVESYIHELYLDQDVQWFPFARALELDEVKEDEDEQEKIVLNKFESNIDGVNRILREIREKLDSDD